MQSNISEPLTKLDNDCGRTCELGEMSLGIWEVCVTVVSCMICCGFIVASIVSSKQWKIVMEVKVQGAHSRMIAFYRRNCGSVRGLKMVRAQSQNNILK